jgi:hypothetical protein
MENAYEKVTNNREEGRAFLRLHDAKKIDETTSDLFRRAVYEIPTTEGAQVYVENESRLEAPEYYYHLWKFNGKEE